MCLISLIICQLYVHQKYFSLICNQPIKKLNIKAHNSRAVENTNLFLMGFLQPHHILEKIYGHQLFQPDFAQKNSLVLLVVPCPIVSCRFRFLLKQLTILILIPLSAPLYHAEIYSLKEQLPKWIFQHYFVSWEQFLSVKRQQFMFILLGNKF